MLRLEAFVDDKKAAKVLYALDGLVIQLTMVPVHNAATKGGKVVGAGGPTTGGQIIAAQIQKSLKEKQTSFTTQEVLELARTYGVSEAGTKSAITVAKNNKQLSKSKHRGVYNIIVKQEKK